MRQHLTAHDLYNQIRMMQTNFRGTVLVCEGDCDCKFLKKFVRAGECITIPGHGKDKVLTVMEWVHRDGRQGIVAMVDADFSRLGGVVPENENIIVTDHHDVEVTLFCSPALDALLVEYSSESMTTNFLESNGQENVRASIFDAAIPIGVLRFMALNEHRLLRFKGLAIDHFIGAGNLKSDLVKMVEEVIHNSPKAGASQDDLLEELNKYLQKKYDPKQVCSGHDLIGILAIALRGVIGKCCGVIAERRNLERVLRLSFGLEHFQETEMYKALKNWEEGHTPYRIIA